MQLLNAANTKQTIENKKQVRRLQTENVLNLLFQLTTENIIETGNSNLISTIYNI
jgi:hypothetical protein